MDVCESCGASLSDGYGKVFGDGDDRVHACPHCEGVTREAIFDGLAADADERNLRPRFRDYRG